MSIEIRPPRSQEVVVHCDVWREHGQCWSRATASTVADAIDLAKASGWRIAGQVHTCAGCLSAEVIKPAEDSPRG